MGPVFLATPTLEINGANVYSLNLARGLAERGADARILVSERRKRVDRPLEPGAGIRVEALDAPPRASRFRRWSALRAKLEAAAPCFYLPNHDWRHSCVSPALDPAVRVVGILHGDDELHYEHARRLGTHWDAIVSVSGAIRRRAIELVPGPDELRPVVPCGVEVPASPPRRARSPDEIRAFWAGRIIRFQKRAPDLLGILRACRERGARVHLRVAGDGPPEEVRAFREAAREFVADGSLALLGPIDNAAVLAECAAAEVFVLPSDSEGMPLCLVEAMSRGCAALATDIPSGVPDLVREGKNGFVVPVGDFAAFADRLARLAGDIPLRERMSAAAFDTVARGPYSRAAQAAAFLDLFARLDAAFARGERMSVRDGRIRPPKGLVPVWTNRFPPPLDGYARRLFGWI